MKYAFMLPNAFLEAHAEALLRRGPLSFREPQAPLGGLGGEANQKNYRRWVPPAMLARTCFTPFISLLSVLFLRFFSAASSYFSDPHSLCLISPNLSKRLLTDGSFRCVFSSGVFGHVEPRACSSLEGPNAQRAKPKRDRPSCELVTSFSSAPTQTKGVLMIPSERLAMHRGRRPMTRSVFVLLTLAALPALAACSSTCRRHELAGRVLDEQNAMLERVLKERADGRVATKVQADSDLKAAEEHLNMAIEMLRRSNGAVKTAL
jgi:hypothetical protein